MGEYINSRQARFDKSYVSCGVVEVHHLPEAAPNQTAFAITNHLYHRANGRPAAFVLFSDVVLPTQESRGQALARFLQESLQADLFESKPVVNPKTGNTIKTWLWTVDHEALRKWYTDEYVNRVTEDT